MLEIFYKQKKKFFLLSCCLVVVGFVWMMKYNILLCFFGIPFDIQKELLSYIKYDIPRTYLLALMNTSERKPDGGFFGSYLLVRLGSGKFIQAYDSYYPQTIANVRVPLPEWFYPVMKIRDVGFLGANMVGFTDIDGKNIVDIYNKTFHEQVDGVFFIKYDMFKYLINNFDELSWKWEFENACIDLIRGFQTGNKKELYFKQIKPYFSWKNLIYLGWRFLLHWSKIRDNGFIRIYIPTGSSKLQQWLVQNNLATLPISNFAYFYDYNLGFNKIDKFVKKEIFFIPHQDLNKNSKGDFDIETQKGRDFKLNIWGKSEKKGQIRETNLKTHSYTTSDRVFLSDFFSGTTYIYIVYGVDIPSSYIRYIEKLSVKYQITLTEREKIILSLLPQIRNRGVVYLPEGFDVIVVGGDGIDVEQFKTPFGVGIKYDIVGKGNEIEKNIWIKVRKNKKSDG